MLILAHDRRKRILLGFGLVAIIALSPFLTYAVMHLMVSLAPDKYEGYTAGPVLATLGIIGLGLIVPYWLLKGLFAFERLRDPHARNFHLSDLPKHQDDVEK